MKQRPEPGGGCGAPAAPLRAANALGSRGTGQSGPRGLQVTLKLTIRKEEVRNNVGIARGAGAAGAGDAGADASFGCRVLTTIEAGARNDGARQCDWAKRADGEIQSHPTRCGEPFKTLFSGAATLIQPCSQAGGEPDPTLFLGLREPNPSAVRRPRLGHRRRRPAEVKTEPVAPPSIVIAGRAARSVPTGAPRRSRRATRCLIPGGEDIEPIPAALMWSAKADHPRLRYVPTERRGCSAFAEHDVGCASDRGRQYFCGLVSRLDRHAAKRVGTLRGQTAMTAEPGPVFF